jgi:excisionase family DNA binding protein
MVGPGQSSASHRIEGREVQTFEEKKMIEIGKVKVFTIEEIAKKFGISTATVRRYLKSGKLSGQRMGVRWYVSENAINEFFLRSYVKPKKGKARQK